MPVEHEALHAQLEAGSKGIMHGVCLLQACMRGVCMQLPNHVANTAGHHDHSTMRNAGAGAGRTIVWPTMSCICALVALRSLPSAPAAASVASTRPPSVSTLQHARSKGRAFRSPSNCEGSGSGSGYGLKGAVLV